MIGAIADLFNEEGALGNQRRRERDDDWRGQSQSVNLPEAGFQEAVRFMDGDMVIVEGVQQIEDQTGLMQRGSVRQQGIHFIASEGAADEQPIGGGMHIHGLPSQQVCDTIREETIAAIQHSDRAAQDEFSRELRALVTSGVRGAEDDQLTGLKNRQEIHAMRILPAPRNKQPPPG